MLPSRSSSPYHTSTTYPVHRFHVLHSCFILESQCPSICIYISAAGNSDPRRHGTVHHGGNSSEPHASGSHTTVAFWHVHSKYCDGSETCRTFSWWHHMYDCARRRRPN